MKAIKTLVRKTLNRFGYDVVRWPKAARPRSVLVDQLIARDISVVLDVGANVGQFARHLRDCGYLKKIVSFEPVSASFARLREQAEADPLWEAIKLALGASSQQSRINVSRNFVSSSIRDLEQKTLAAEPSVEYLYSELIAVEPLDALFERFVKPTDRAFLKVDVQGYENEVFQGATQSLSLVEGVVLECSLSSLYKGEWLLHDVIDYFASRGFTLSNIEREFGDSKTGELLQVNTLFWNVSCTADSPTIKSKTGK